MYLSKEGYFAKNNFVTFILSSNRLIIAEIYNMRTYSLVSVAYNSLYEAHTFSLENSIQYSPFIRKTDMSEMRSKKRDFPLLVGSCM